MNIEAQDSFWQLQTIFNDLLDLFFDQSLCESTSQQLCTTVFNSLSNILSYFGHCLIIYWFVSFLIITIVQGELYLVSICRKDRSRKFWRYWRTIGLLVRPVFGFLVALLAIDPDSMNELFKYLIT